jgi:oligopeptide transport system permease protein
MAWMFFLKRIIFMVPVLLIISMMTFGIMRMAPGGPFDRERKPASPDIERNLQAKYHLDEPMWKQYGRFLIGLTHGDLGPSLKYRNHSVMDIIKQGLPVSLVLGGCAFLFAMGIGLPLGFYAALRQNTWSDHLLSFVALLTICVPGFVVGPVLIMVFALYWKIFPVALWESPMHAVLPTAALGLYYAGRIARLLRQGLIESMQAEYIVTARAKGLSETAVVFKHALRLALLPVVSYSGPLLADLMTGSFVVENIFQIPGIGVFMVNSSLNRDYTMVMGLVLLYAVLLLVLNLVVDMIYGILDPRVRFD